MNTQIYRYSWQDLINDSLNLSSLIGKGKFKFILAISKGGIIPAYYVSEALGISVVKTICLSSFRGKGTVRGPIVHTKIDGFLETIKNPRDWLVVGDISDTGVTLEYIKREYPAITVATLIQKRSGGFKSDFFAREVDNLWVKMPYER